MVSLLASSAVDRGLEPRSDQTKENKIGICCFSVKNAALRRKNKDWLWNQRRFLHSVQNKAMRVDKYTPNDAISGDMG